jgi:multidrug efflux pump subunit AcrA (membrane-fusion protein)/YHS domain-containing protein
MNKPATVGSALFLSLLAFAVGRYSNSTAAKAGSSSKRVLYYVDPMHPSYHSPKPGIAPDCGMELEPVYESDDSAEKTALPEGAVAITLDKQRLIGVQVETVKRNAAARVIRTTGRVEAEDSRVYRLTAATEGWVQSLEDKAIGAKVKKDELLASFYSREFRNAQQAYLGALASAERVKTGGTPEDPNSIVRTNEEQLHAMGMGDPQIKELAKKRQTMRDISVVSPVDGIVLGRNISPDQRFEKGTELYRIGDLSKVWIEADLFDDQAGTLRAGQRVKVTVRELSKTVYATVTENPPLFDAASRTLKVRLEADNPGFTLRPDMFVDVEFDAKVPEGIFVPQEALLDSGTQKVVYVETSGGVFEPRAVDSGTVYGSVVSITGGLHEGERIATSGTFLIDSESRMRSNTSGSPSVAPANPKAPTAPATKHDMKQMAVSAVSIADPVCGMPLNAEQAQSAAHTEQYHGKTFKFCSDKCQKKFHQDPARYADAEPSTMAGSLRAPRHE